MSENVAGIVEAAPLRRRGHKKSAGLLAIRWKRPWLVSVDSVRRHPLYHKRITRTSKFLAHDEQNTCKPGDM
jgi:small subunit ribosomal protein S17